MNELTLQKATAEDWELISKIEQSGGSKLFAPIGDKSETLEYIQNNNVYIIKNEKSPGKQ